jgi:hypothetical protein
MKNLQLWVASVLVVLLFPVAVFALDPNDYIPPPPGTHVAVLYYDHLSGNDTYRDGRKVSTASDFTGDVFIFRYCYWDQINGIPVAFSALVPAGELTLDNAGLTGQQISSSEIGDPVIVFVVWPFSQPQTRTWLALAQYITAPLGQYAHDKPSGLQLAQNQWAFKEEVAFVQGFGPVDWNLSGFVQFYTDNNKYTPSDLTLKKDPLYNIETHVIWHLAKSFSISADYFYQRGGETSVMGISNNDKLEDHTAGISFGFQITPATHLQLRYRDTFQTENGITVKDFGLRVCYFF